MTSDYMLTIDVNTRIEQWQGQYAGYIEELGVTVYGKQPMDVLDRSRLMVEFFFKYQPMDADGAYHEEWLKAYLDSHHVPYEVVSGPNVLVGETVDLGVVEPEIPAANTSPNDTEVFRRKMQVPVGA